MRRIVMKNNPQRISIFMMLMTFVLLDSGPIRAFEKQDNGIVIKLKKEKPTDLGMIGIQVCTANIIRVRATPGDAFSSRPSLMVQKKDWKPVPWSVKEQGNQIVVSTSKLTVKLQKERGTVVFYDKNDRLILQEKPGNGKIITPVDVMGEKTNHIRQVFNLTPDEAIYGFGQHQNGVMNHRGHDVDLWQHNMVAAVPFLVSSGNYGILWDNYSRTKFGDVRDYQPLSYLTLYNKQGEKGGLTVEYYSDSSFNSVLTSQTEAKIEHDFADQPGAYPEGFDRKRGSICWSGEIASDQTGIHKFRLYSSGYIRMWLNGELVVDAWRQNWLPWTHLPCLLMEATKRYPVKIEWVPNDGYIGLKYLSPEKRENKNTISLYSEVADQIDYYFIYGDNLDQVIQGYRKVTGRVPMMPKWAMGFWQCRERYRSQEELLSVVKEFRKRRIPLDNIVQDWFYWKQDQWGSHEFDPMRFPDADGMVKELHDNYHCHIMISVWPKFYVGTKHFDEFKERGWLYMHSVEKGQKDWVGPGYVSTFFDPFSDGARDLYWKQMNEKLFNKGFDAWWLDATEPDLGSNVSDSERLLRMHPNALGTAARYENAYSLMTTKGVYEKQRETSPNQRVFILTRSAYAGQQRHSAATWSGDVAARWDDLRAQIPAGLNFCLSGIPWWTTDIGGFAVEPRYEHAKGDDLEEWRELNTRWFQFGTFCPLFRVHGQFPYREMFNIAPENHPAYQTMLAYDKLRYRLMPYIYSLAAMVTHKDYTIMRALVMDFGQQDKKVLDIGDQYMFGPAIMVCPVTELKARKRQVYLPAGTGWYDFKSGRYFEGGQVIQADAPYTDMPIFIREGSIIPFGPAVQYTSEKPADPIRLLVYTGRNGAFMLYEDDGISYDYEKGAHSMIPIRYSEKEQSLTIGARQGQFPGMLNRRRFEIVWVGRDKPVALNFDAAPARSVLYDGQELAIKRK